MVAPTRPAHEANERRTNGGPLDGAAIRRFRPSQWTFRRWLIVTSIAWLLVCGYLVFDAQYRARRAADDLEVIAQLDDMSTIDLDSLVDTLERSNDDFGQARANLSSPVLAPLKIVPVLGRQLRSAERLVAVSSDITQRLLPVADLAQQGRDSSNDRVALLLQMSAQLANLNDAIADPDFGPTTGLVGPLADGRDRLVARTAELADMTRSAETSTAGLAAVMSDGTYLLLGGNNAEMRLGAGMVLSIGEIDFDRGEVDMPGFTPADNLAPLPASPLVDADVGDRWGFLNPSDDFRKLNYSGRFADYVAPQALAMWEQLTGRRLDGVIYLDAFAFRGVLEAVGPVELDGRTIDSDNVVTFLLQDQYNSGSGSGETPDGAVVDARRDALSRLATVASERIGQGDWDPLGLIQAMGPVVEGGHLLGFATDPVENQLWEDLDMTGRLTGNETGVYLLNNGASKLDPYLEIEVDVRVEPATAGRRIVLNTTITNNATADLDSYVLGPWNFLDLAQAGTYIGRVALYAPGTATDVVIEGHELDVLGPDGPVVVGATAPIAIEPGEVLELQVSYVLPDDVDTINVLPSGRFPAIRYSAGDQNFSDVAVTEISP